MCCGWQAGYPTVGASVQLGAQFTMLPSIRGFGLAAGGWPPRSCPIHVTTEEGLLPGAVVGGVGAAASHRPGRCGPWDSGHLWPVFHTSLLKTFLSPALQPHSSQVLRVWPSHQPSQEPAGNLTWGLVGVQVKCFLKLCQRQHRRRHCCCRKDNAHPPPQPVHIPVARPRESVTALSLQTLRGRG